MGYDTAIVLAHELNKDKSLTQETRERVDLGIKLYRENKTRTLLMSGGHADLGECYGISLARAMKNYAVSKNVPENSIIEEDLSLETVGQLIFCKIGVINPKGWKKIIIFSHAYHIPRVRAISNLVFGSEYKIGFEDIKSDLNFDIKILEKERASENIFRDTFGSVHTGDDRALLERLLERHNSYKNCAREIREKLEKLKKLNLS